MNDTSDMGVVLFVDDDFEYRGLESACAAVGLRLVRKHSPRAAFRKSESGTWFSKVSDDERIPVADLAGVIMDFKLDRGGLLVVDGQTLPDGLAVAEWLDGAFPGLPVALHTANDMEQNPRWTPGRFEHLPKPPTEVDVEFFRRARQRAATATPSWPPVGDILTSMNPDDARAQLGRAPDHSVNGNSLSEPDLKRQGVTLITNVSEAPAAVLPELVRRLTNAGPPGNRIVATIDPAALMTYEMAAAWDWVVHAADPLKWVDGAARDGKVSLNRLKPETLTLLRQQIESGVIALPRNGIVSPRDVVLVLVRRADRIATASNSASIDTGHLRQALGGNPILTLPGDVPAGWGAVWRYAYQASAIDEAGDAALSLLVVAAIDASEGQRIFGLNDLVCRKVLGAARLRGAGWGLSTCAAVLWHWFRSEQALSTYDARYFGSKQYTAFAKTLNRHLWPDATPHTSAHRKAETHLRALSAGTSQPARAWERHVVGLMRQLADRHG